FGRLNLGKGVVIAKDTPGFVGNRVGTFELMHSIHTWLEGAYSIEEIDALTGPLIGRPTSATFRTSDVIGLDTLVHIVDYLHSAVEGESRDVLVVPALMKNLIADGAFGAKVGRGFYKKEGAEILSINPKTMAYESATELDLGDLSTISRQIAVQDRIRSLYEDEGRAGAFTRNHVLKTLAFCARRIPEISDSPADIDRVMRWGFGWEIGPFEIWDALGIAQVVEDMSANGIDLPKWVTAMAEEEQPSFYCGKDQDRTVYVPVKGYAANPQPLDEIQLSVIASNPQQILWQNDDAVLLNLGNQVALYEFRSKANSLGHAVVGGILEVIDMIEEGDFRGLVIGNQGKHFSVGANLKEMMALQGKWNEMGELLVRFQTMIQRIHYAGKPVVVTTHGLVLGGGCEMAMASTHPVADAESCIGLVELGVGLIPAGCGTMRLAAYAHEQAPDEDENHIQAYLDRYLETLRLAKVSESAHQAQEMGLLPNHTRIVMNTDRRLYVAKEEVIRLSNQGYAPPPERNAIKVLGEPGRAHFEATTLTMMQDKLISEFDRYLAERLAWIMTGGDLTNSAYVHENYLMELEREVFLSLLGEEKTQARIESILTQNKLLRN
ncbi:MAG: 3-hydroxyacyl-CoA dehydrogenase family protein, partial [Candidatus Latescibacteria bacterium]|nr:3-hydroxyacyl-CoA dehydrogenase family protein [Candidatus Latescibacterota bacterium]